MAGAAELTVKLIGQDLASAAFKSATASLRGLSNAATAPIRAVGAVQGALDSAAKSAAVTGGILTAAVTAPIVGGFAKAIAKVIDLETNLNVLQAVTGASAAQMAAASAKAIELGKDITLPGVTAAKATEAMLELGKAGLSFDNVLSATRGTLQLATAGQLDFADAAKITGQALNAFHLGGDQATRVADLLAAAANASSGSVTDMSYALRQASANAAAAGVPIEQVVAAISLMSNAGVASQDAGTSLKQFFLSLTKDSKPAIKAQKQLGVSFVDTAGNIKPLPTIIADLNKAITGLPSGTRQQALDKIFGSDAGRAAFILGEAGTKGFNDMLAAVSKVGVANDVASARTKGLAGAIENLNNAWEALTTQALLPILPVITKIVTLGSDLITAFDRLSPTTKGMIVAFTGVLAAAGPILLIFAGLAAAVAFLLTPFGLIVGVLAVMAANFVKARGGLAAFVPGIESMATALSHVLKGNASPSILAQEFERAFGSKLTNQIKSVVGAITGGFRFARDAILTFIGALSGNWAGGASAKVDPVTKAIGNLGLFIRETVIPAVTSLSVWFLNVAVPALQQFSGFVTTSVVPALQQLADWFQSQILPKLQAFGNWFMTEAIPAIQPFADLIKLTLLGRLIELGKWLLTEGPAALNTFGDWFKGDGAKGLQSFADLIKTVGDTVNAIVGPAFKTLGENAGAIFNALGPLAEALSGLLLVLKPVADAIGTLFGAIVAALPGLITQLTGFITSLTGGIKLIEVLFTGLANAATALQRGDLAGAGAAIAKAWDEAGKALAKVDEGQRKVVAGGAMVQGGIAGFVNGQQTVPPGTLFGPPAPASAFLPQGQNGLPVQNAFTTMNTFGQQLDALNGKLLTANQRVDDWNKKMEAAPADVQTAVTRWMQEF